MKLSNFLTLESAMYSETAIRKGLDNTPTQEHLENLKYLGTYLDKIYAQFPNLKLNSVYRGKKLNTAIGGAISSFHCIGAASDLSIVNKAEMFNWIKINLDFTELIWEFGDSKQPAWVHFAVVKGREKEKEILKAVSVNGRTTYRNFK